MQSYLLIKEMQLAFKWYKKLTKRFIDLALSQTASIVVATIFSQFFMLVSSVLPLKVIMLLSSESVPSYLPPSWQLLGRDALIGCFALAAVVFYLLYLLSEKIISVCALKGSRLMLENNQKVVLFEKQDIFAQNSYAKQSKSLANIIFFFLALLGIAIFYPILSLVVLFFIFMIYILFDVAYRNNHLRDSLNDSFNNTIDITKGAFFFIIFAFILGSFITDFYPPHVVVAILSILLVRQMFLKLADAVKDIRNLYKNRVKINSLFLFSHTSQTVDYDKKDPFWSMLEPQSREQWIKKILHSMLEGDFIYKSSEWLQIDIRNIAHLKITITYLGEEKILLLKLYHSSVSAQAIHEATLLQECRVGLVLIGSSLAQGFHCNLLQYNRVCQADVNKYAFNHRAVRLKLMSTKPPQNLVNRYERSHRYLYQSINKSIFNRLYVVCKDSEHKTIKEFENNFNNILQIVKQLPLQIINPLVTKQSLIEVDNELSLLHWGGWKIDSIGVDYPINLSISQEQYSIYQDKRDDMKNIETNDIILASFLAQFHKFYLAENFTSAIALIPNILKYAGVRT